MGRVKSGVTISGVKSFSGVTVNFNSMEQNLAESHQSNCSQGIAGRVNWLFFSNTISSMLTTDSYHLNTR